MQVYLVFSLAPVVGHQLRRPGQPGLNMAVIIALLSILSRLARTALAASDGRSIVVFGRWGFVGLCLYLAFLYGVLYFKLRPEGLPSVRVQLLTLLIYALVILGLRLHQPREPLPVDLVEVEPRELRLAMAVFAWVIGLGFVLSFVGRRALHLRPVRSEQRDLDASGFPSDRNRSLAGCQGVPQPSGWKPGPSTTKAAVLWKPACHAKKMRLDDPNPCVP